MHVKKSLHDHYIKWHIQRPDRFNGLGLTIGQELIELLEQLQTDLKKGLQFPMLAITCESALGKSGTIAIAGGDLKELSQLKTREAAFAYGRLYQNLCLGLQKLPIPVVSAVDGQVIGGGIEFLLGSDLRLATEHSSFHFKQTAIGLATGYGGTSFLARQFGESRASGWLLLNQTLSAKEALKEGLIHQLISEEEDLSGRLEQIAEHFSQQSPEGIASQKAMLHVHDQAFIDRLARELNLFADVWRNPKHEDFLTKFLKKT